MTDAKTSPYYTQSNGDVTHHSTVGLHRAIGYLTLQDKPADREAEIFGARDRKLAEARQRRQQRQAPRDQAPAAPAPRPAIDFAALRAVAPIAAALQLIGYQSRSKRDVQQLLYPLFDVAGLPAPGNQGISAIQLPISNAIGAKIAG
jgi:hypothetical protein